MWLRSACQTYTWAELDHNYNWEESTTAAVQITLYSMIDQAAVSGRI